MKGVKKCFLFSFTLMAVSLVSCLGICSRNTYAKKHDIQAIPLYSDTYWYGGHSGLGLRNPSFTIQWAPDYFPSYRPVKNTVWYSYSSDGNRCLYNGQHNDGYSSYYNDFQIGFFSYQGFPSNADSYYQNNELPVIQCQQANYPFGTLNPNAFGLLQSKHPNFDRDSFYGLTPVTTSYFQGLLPYYYDYSHIYVSGASYTSPDTGIEYATTLKMSDVFNSISSNIPVPVTKFRSLTIPFGFFRTENLGGLSFGRSVEYKGAFIFPGATFNNGVFSWASDFRTNGRFQLVFSGVTELPNTDDITNYQHEQVVDCDIDSIYSSTGEGDGLYVGYSCPLILDSEYEVATAWLEIENLASGSYIFDTTADWSWSGFYVITDSDDTPGANYNDEPTGNHLDEAPGSPQAEAEEHEGDSGGFFNALTNLFGFSFLNPFAPLFTMFTESNTCANIPIIAGMLHAEESTYCSWFSSETRGILTPVLGIAGMMLVFGFAVRWLGASSGNMFEDSGHIEPPGSTVKNGTLSKHGWRRR